jgi:hypothetical protein
MEDEKEHKSPNDDSQRKLNGQEWNARYFAQASRELVSLTSTGTLRKEGGRDESGTLKPIHPLSRQTAIKLGVGLVEALHLIGHVRENSSRMVKGSVGARKRREERPG